MLSLVFGSRDQLDPTGMAWRWCHLVGPDPDAGIPGAIYMGSFGRNEVI